MTRALLFACLCGLATGSAQAQFNLDINRLIDTAKSIGQANTEIDQQGEIEIGRDVAARLLGAAPLHPDASLQRYVNERNIKSLYWKNKRAGFLLSLRIFLCLTHLDKPPRRFLHVLVQRIILDWTFA